MELMTKSCYTQFSGFAFNCYLMIIGEWYLSKRKLYWKLTIFFWSEQSFIFFKQWPYIIITTTDFLRLYHCDLFPVTVNIHCLSIPCSCTWYSCFWLGSAMFLIVFLSCTLMTSSSYYRQKGPSWVGYIPYQGMTHSLDFYLIKYLLASYTPIIKSLISQVRDSIKDSIQY